MAAPIVVVYYHFRKMGGTSVRDVFARDGRYAVVPYCLPESAAVARVKASVLSGNRSVFWENHCAPKLPDAPRTVALLRAQLAGRARVFAFTTLRDPVSLVPSEYNYFHKSKLGFEDFVELNAELLLFGSRTCDVYPFFGFRSDTKKEDGSCDGLQARAVTALRAFDRVLFYDDVRQWHTRLPPDLLRSTAPWPASNRRRHATNDSWVARHNACSMRVYAHLRQLFGNA